jgi:hypothetical protein
MLRRFEMYKFRKGTSEATIDHVATVLRECGRYIPEVLDSVAARNLSDTDIDLIWENAYESPESYARYMRHPYHICILDRYLLPDHPECVIGPPEDLGLGLLGYEIARPEYRRARGLRRIVCLRMAADADPADVARLEANLRRAPERSPELALSIVARNPMGEEWFPGVWTHIWEQAFEGEDGLARFAAAEKSLLGPPVAASASVHYWLDASGKPRRRSGAQRAEGERRRQARGRPRADRPRDQEGRA